jgi:hypothetical protein
MPTSSLPSGIGSSDSDPGRAIAVDPRGPDSLHVWLADGREFDVPWTTFSRLAQATPAQRRRVHLRLGGLALRWDDPVDEDLDVAALAVQFSR